MINIMNTPTVRLSLLSMVSAVVFLLAGCDFKPKPTKSQERWVIAISSMRGNLKDVTNLANDSTDIEEKKGWVHKANGYRRAIAALEFYPHDDIPPTPYNAGFFYPPRTSNDPRGLLVQWIETKNDVVGVRLFSNSVSVRFDGFRSDEYVARDMRHAEYLYFIDKDSKQSKQFPSFSDQETYHVEVSSNIIESFKKEGEYQLRLILKDGTESKSIAVYPLIEPKSTIKQELEVEATAGWH